MNPSQAMGTFLRTWRAEWAALSRAQLAIAISAHLPKRRSLTTKVIRKWEEGQPPNSTGELEALCKVMRRHGLAAVEVEDFRSAVFSACVDRYYPELSPDGSLADRPDVDEVAARWLDRNWVTGHYERPIAAVAAAHELTRAVRGGGPGKVSAAQFGRQQVAHAFLQLGLARHNSWNGRHAAERARAAALRTFVEADFGLRSPDRRLSGLALRLAESNALALQERDAGRSGHGIRRVLAVSEEALARGDRFIGLEGFYAALLHPAAFSPAEYQSLVERGDRLMELVLQGECDTWWGPHSCMTLASLWIGDIPEAVRHFEGLRAHADEAPVAELHVEDCAGLVAWHTGCASEAMAHFERALAIARTHGQEKMAEGIARRVKACVAGREPPTPLY